MFHNNNLISNAGKSHLIMSSKENLDMQALSCSIKNEGNVKLVRIHINNNLNFDYHVNQLCKNASKKLHALIRTSKYIAINTRRMLMKAFVSSKLSYCSLILMFYSRKMEHKIKNIYKRALKLVYEEFHNLAFQEKN